MYRYASLFMCLFVSCALHAQALESEQSVYLFNDGYCDAAMKDLQKSAKEHIASKKISWKQKSDSGVTWSELKNDYEKLLLKKEADCYVLSLGIADVWDKRKKTALAIDESELQNSIDAVIQALSNAEKQIVLLTPHVLLEGTNKEANTQINKLATIIKKFADKENVYVCDIHAAFNEQISLSEPAKRGKGICTKDGYKLNDTGEAAVIQSLSTVLGVSPKNDTSFKTISIKKKDYVVFANGFYKSVPTKNFNDASRALYEASMGFECPRLGSTKLLGESLLEEGIADRILAQRGTHYILLPTFAYHVKVHNKIFVDGTYEKKFIELIKEMKSKTKSPIYLMTPLIWSENDEESKIVVDGPLYKMSEDHANTIRKVASLTKCPIIDIHQQCLDIINEKGTEGIRFSSERKVKGKAVSMGAINKELGRKLVMESLIELTGLKFRY